MDNRMKVKVKLELDAEWASNYDKAELIEFLRDNWSNALGFRGEIRSLNIVKR